jgi:molybdate transport system ATP-binding protein
MLDFNLQWRRGSLDLQVEAILTSPITAVYGPSGAGKTSLLKLICGLHEPDCGRLVLDDHVFFDSRRGVCVAPERRRVALLFQDDRLFPHLDVRANLLYGQRLQPLRRRRVQFDEVVELLEIGGLLGRSIHALSGGERQRVALGRALLTSPRLLLLDEPLAGLDRRLKDQILPFLRRAHERFAIPLICVSHELDDILQMTDQLLVMAGGRRVSAGSLHDVLSDPQALSLARSLGLDNVLPVRVQGHLREEQLTRLQIGGADGPMILAPRTEAAADTQLFVAVRSADIALATEVHEGLSIQNQVPGRIIRLHDHEGKVLVEVDVGRSMFLEVSRRAASDLRLAPGKAVFCLFKALGVRYLSTAGN